MGEKGEPLSPISGPGGTFNIDEALYKAFEETAKTEKQGKDYSGHKIIYYKTLKANDLQTSTEQTFYYVKERDAKETDLHGYTKLSINKLVDAVKERWAEGTGNVEQVRKMRERLFGSTQKSTPDAAAILKYVGEHANKNRYSGITGAIRWIASKIQNWFSNYGFTTSAERAEWIAKALAAPVLEGNVIIPPLEITKEDYDTLKFPMNMLAQNEIVKNSSQKERELIQKIMTNLLLLCVDNRSEYLKKADPQSQETHLRFTMAPAELKDKESIDAWEKICNNKKAALDAITSCLAVIAKQGNLNRIQ